MATPQWDALKETIYSLDATQSANAAKFFGIAPESSLSRTHGAISQAAFQHSKRNANQFRSIAASYDATRQAMVSAAYNGASIPNHAYAAMDTNGRNAADNAAREAAERANAASMGIATQTASEPVATSSFDPSKLISDMCEYVDAKLASAGAVPMGDIRAMIDAAIDRKPAMKIEITKGAETVATLDGTQHKQMSTLLRAVSARQSDGFRPSVWLAGPAGSGKTYAAKMLAKALGLGFEYNGALSMAHEVLGYRDAAGSYHDTAFYRAYGAASLYLFDEIDGCADNQPLMALNAALANGTASFPNGLRERHADNVIVAGANTFGLGSTADYVGRIKLDAAILDRFPVKIFWTYDEALELAMSGNEAWARKVQGARKRAHDAGLKVLITPRATLAGAALIAAGFSMDEAATMTYLGNLSPDQARIVGAR